MNICIQHPSGGFMVSHSRLALSVAFCLVIVAPELRALQGAVPDSAIIGIVVSNAATRTPLENAELRIDGVAGVRLSDYVGEISFKWPRSSSMRLRVTHAGFASVDTTFQVGNMDWMHVMLALAPAAQPVAGAVAAAPAVRPAGHLAGFEERRARGRGRYITPEQLRESHDRKLLELLERVPGLSSQASSTGRAMVVARTGPTSIVEPGSQSYDVRVRGKAPPAQGSKTFRSNDDGQPKPGYCAVAVFLDGIYAPDIDIGSMRATGFDAVEYYTPSNIPPEFKRPGTQCGVLLLWSR